MPNTTDLRGFCPSPFLDASKFPTTGGSIEGRICGPVPLLDPNLVCCLPCPFTEWIYPASFQVWYLLAESFSVVGLAICVFLLVTWAVLPPEKTRRHYLSTCLVIGILMMTLAFVIPLGAKPPQCYNDITPNDMFTNLTCAFSGAFLVAGGVAVAIWIFIRALSMHLQICWDLIPGERFFYASLGIGWGLAAALFTLTMVFTGVSFRFGDTCHVNSVNSLKDFWGPLLCIASLAGLIQLMTFLYCIKVYLQNMFSDDATDTTNSTGLPSFTTSIRAHSAKAVYRRVRRVIWLQWRSITIGIFLLVDVIFFSIIWIELDNDVNAAMKGDLKRFMPYLLCLFESGGEKTKCFKLGQKTLVNESTAIAILLLISLTGVQAGLMMSRIQMFTGWYDLVKRKFISKREFVSLDAKRFSSDARAFELLKIGTSSAATAPNSSNMPQTLADESAYHVQEIERQWRKPTMSFAGPQTPSNAATRMDWELPNNRGARGGLGLHPPRSPSNSGDEDIMENKI